MNDNNNRNSAFDAKTMIAMVLMVIVLTAGMAFQNKFFPREPIPVEPTKTEAPKTVVTPTVASSSPSMIIEAENAPLAEEKYTINTSVYEAVFTNRGGEIVSLKLKNHKDKGSPVEMFVPKNGKTDGLSLSLGSKINGNAEKIDTLMNVSQPEKNVIIFSVAMSSKDSSGNEVPFILSKRFEFNDDEYMIKLSVKIDGINGSIPAIGDGQYAYSLNIGPQIGPTLETISNYSDFRRIYSYEGNKKKIQKKATENILDSQARWAAITGKYFSIVVIPESKPFSYQYVNSNIQNKPEETSLSFSRNALSANTQIDNYYIYAGPKDSKQLARYNDPTANAFKRTSDDLEGVMETGNILGWLETILKWCLNFFYNVVGNYGVAIILVVILVKALMFPLTFKGSKATARMQELQPKMQEIQAKHKNNPQKLNEEMAAFYKEEGYNPMSGCIPQLIQIPIFFAMYALFNNHFDLRGASFIPGWINDLSVPDAIIAFPTINLVIWKLSALRGLPIIYLLSQLLYGKLIQQPTSAGGQNAGQMKFMMYGMPIIFFFVLYDVPSGLLVYWIASNIFTAAQQIIINKVIKKKESSEPAKAETPQKIVPPKAKKKRK